MNFSYENQGSNTYLVYTIQAEDVIDSLSLGMLTNNKIRGLAPVLYSQMDHDRYIKFNVSSRVPAAQLLSGPVNKRRLLGVIGGIIDAMTAAEDYMLDPDAILLDMNYIFTNVSTGETVLVCLPLENMEKRTDTLTDFLRTIIFNAKYDQTESFDHVARMINFLNGSPALAFDEFKGLLEELSREGVPAPTPGPASASNPVPAAKPQPRINVNKPAPAPLVTPAPIPPVTQAPQPKHVPDLKVPPVDDGPSVPKEEKPISLFYLLQHYNKDNAAAYKAQKEAKKQVSPKTKEKKGPVKEKKEKKAAPNLNFAIPGQAPSGIPQQSAPAEPAASVGPALRNGTYTPPAQPDAEMTNPQKTVQMQSVPNNFGETTVLIAGAAGETTVLAAPAAAAAAYPYLIRIKNNEKIPVNKPVFRLGKERSYVDYFVGDNTAVSRSHANIIARDGAYFIMDTNSTNHTFINGVMIQSNVEVAVNHGDTIRLANEEFEFHLF